MRVVNINFDECTHYIGRSSVRHNPLSNRYSHKPSKVPGTILVKNREEALTRFEQEARSSPEIRRLIAELPEDAVLGCFCKPLDCHGDIIMEIWKEMHGVQPAA